MKQDKKRSLFIDVNSAPIYNSGVRAGPGQMVTNLKEYGTIIKTVFTKTFIWFLTCHLEQVKQTNSSCTGFNIQVNMGKYAVPDNIGYLPTINTPATKMSTAVEILNTSQNYKHQLDIKHMVLVFDQALYTKVYRGLLEELRIV